MYLTRPHRATRRGPEQPVDGPLERSQNHVAERGAVEVDPAEVGPEPRGDREDEAHDEDDVPERLHVDQGSHPPQNFSGWIIDVEQVEREGDGDDGEGGQVRGSARARKRGPSAP